MKKQGKLIRTLMHVPILLPTGRDAELVGNLLEKEMIDVVVCPSLHMLLEQISQGCGLFILGDEVLSETDLGRLLQTLDKQPEWSDLQAILFLGRYPKRKTLNLIATRRSINLIQRPVKKAMLIIMVRTALEVRRRQYQIRDLLLELRQTNEKLGRRTYLLQKLALELTKSEEKERSRIARILHDDLQQILVSAKIQTGMLTDSFNDDIAGSVQTLYETISRAIDTSRSLSHELNPSFLYGSDLGSLLKKISAQMAENYGLNITTTIEINTTRVTDRVKIFVFRTIQELLLNVAKHSRSDRVSLEITGQDNFLTITVTDYGTGFNAEKLKIQGGREGGFGLFSIQERVEALGGSFHVESSPHTGSRFVLNVPAGAEDVENEKEVGYSDMLNIAFVDNDLKKEDEKAVVTVMIADDHAVMRQGLASLLQNQPDIRVAGEAANGEQAVELALKLRPDVILMDVSMPLLNGMEATRRINREAPEIAVIGLSMHVSEEVRKKMMEAGARDYLLKDRPASELLSAIKRFAHFR